MNNWRLLLLAVVVVVQPIGSFTESNLIDGRDCCKRSEDARLYGHRKADERRSLDFKTDDRLTANEERRLRSLNGIREEERYETIRSPMLTRSETLDRNERHNSLELSRFMNHRFTREQERRSSDENRNRHVSRNILGENKRDSRESKNRNIMDATRPVVRVSRDTRDARFVTHESGNTMSRLPIRFSRSIEERRLLPARDTNILKREQEGIARNSKFSTPAIFDSRMQRDDNRERRIFNHRNQEESNEFRQTRVVRVELRRRDTGLRDRISSSRRKSENSAEKLRQSRNENKRLTRAGMDIKYNKRIDKPKKQRDENRRSMNTEERHLDPMQERDSISLDTTRNDERSEQQSISMDRTSRASEENTSYVRAARIRTVKVENLDTPSQERANHRISRDRTTQSRRTVTRMDFTIPTVSQRQQREIRAVEQRKESRNNVVRMNARKSGSQERRQVSRLSRDTTISALREIQNTERVQESRRTVRKNTEDRMHQRENGQFSKDKNSILRAVRDKTEQELREGVWESSERRPRENNRLSNNIVSVLRTDREFSGGTEQAQESRKEINFRKLDSRTLRNARDHERSDLRRQTLQRSMERARITRSISAERGIDARGTSRISRSIEDSKLEKTRTIDGDKHTLTRDQDRAIEQRMTRKVITPQRLVDRRVRRSSRTESFRVERAIRNREVEERDDHDRTQRAILQRVSRNVDQQPQRHEVRRSSRPDSNRLERFVRSRTQFKENVRREMQQKERDGGRTRIILNRRSNERVSAVSRIFWESSKDYRKAPITRNRDEARNEKTLAERRQENREIARDFRTAGEARIAEIRSERVLSESIPEIHDSRNVRGEIRMDDRLDSRFQRDATRSFRNRSLQRQSRDATEHLNERSRIVIATGQNEREVRNNERQIRFDRSSEAGNAHRESRSNIRGNKYFSTERMESHLKDGKREERSFRNIDAGTFQDSLVQDADEIVSNWQIVFYTLQAVYLCGLLIQMLTENTNKSKKRTCNWWSTPKNLIKVD